MIKEKQKSSEERKQVIISCEVKKKKKRELHLWRKFRIMLLKVIVSLGFSVTTLDFFIFYGVEGRNVTKFIFKIENIFYKQICDLVIFFLLNYTS